MANRHKAQAGKFNVGGALEAGGNPNVIKEAKQRKDGGVAKHASGGKVSGYKDGGRLDKRARGGALKLATGGGADKSPFSSAHFKSGGAAKKG